MYKVLLFLLFVNMSFTIFSQATYGIYKMRTAEYINELGVWDDFSDWFETNDNVCYAKFIGSGVIINLRSNGENTKYYGTNLSYTRSIPSTSGNSTFYQYSGFAKQNGTIKGNFTLYVLDHTLSDLKNGNVNSPRFDVRIDYAVSQLFSEGLISSLIKGLEQFEMNFMGIKR